MTSNAYDPRTAASWLADAERYEAWAARTEANALVSGNFQRLAVEARARAAARGG
jgi:hypothetical protein